MLDQDAMRILFTISVVACVALLWAFVSTAQYIRRARTRRKLLEEFASERAARLTEPPSGFAPVKILSIVEFAAPPSLKLAAPVEEPEPAVFAESTSDAAEPPPIPESMAEVPPPPIPETSAPISEARWPLARHRTSSSTAAPIYAEPEPQSEPKPEAMPEPVAAAPEVLSPLKRPPVSVTQRPYSAYFTEDMGDLSDPEPGSGRFPRFKDRFRQG